MTSTKYIGMDVHSERISIAVRNSVGKIVMECVVETKASTILQFKSSASLDRAPDQYQQQSHASVRQAACWRRICRCFRDASNLRSLPEFKSIRWVCL